MGELCKYSQDDIRSFIEFVPSILQQEDIFGPNPKIVRIHASDLSISTTDPEKKCLITAFFEKSGSNFEFSDSEHIYTPFENGVLKPGVIYSLRKTK